MQENNSQTWLMWQRDQTLMSPVVKSGNEAKEPGKEEAKRIIKHAIAASSQWPVPTHGPLVRAAFPLFLHFPQLRSAGHRNCLLWFLQPAVRQDITLHSLPLSGSVCGWVCVNVWGGVHHRGWKRSKISLQRYCHLHNWASLSPSQDRILFLFLSRFPSVSLPPLFLRSDSRLISSILQDLWTRQPVQRASYFTVTPPCNKCRGSRSSYSYSVVLRNCISPQRQREHSYEEAAHCWNQPHPLSMLQTKGGIRKAGLPMQITSLHDCGALNAHSVIWANVCCVHQSSLG